jgi:hypothetical protein
MRQFRIRQVLESVAWTAVAMAAFQAFLRLDGPRSLTTRPWFERDGIRLLALWMVAGVAAGNAVAALFGRRGAWSVVGICWMLFLILLWDYWSYFR